MEPNTEPSQSAPTAHQFTDTVGLTRKVPLTKSWLEKDRIGAKLIPFIKVGDKVIYDVPKVLQALDSMTVGGTTSRRGRRAA